VRNKVLHRFEVDGKMLYGIKRRKDNSIGHTLLRNCLIKRVMEGKMEVRIKVTRRL
jgi:hypothetical protein